MQCIRQNQVRFTRQDIVKLVIFAPHLLAVPLAPFTTQCFPFDRRISGRKIRCHKPEFPAIIAQMYIDEKINKKCHLPRNIGNPHHLEFVHCPGKKSCPSIHVITLNRKLMYIRVFVDNNIYIVCCMKETSTVLSSIRYVMILHFFMYMSPVT
jgi:hypothetical protein